MAEIDTNTSLIIGDDRRTAYDCKGKTDLYLPCTEYEFKTGTHDGKPAFQGAKASGTTLKVTIYMNMYTDDQGEHWGDITLTFKNYDSIKNVYCLKNNDDGKKGGSHNSDDYNLTSNLYQFVVEDLWIVNEDKYSLTGSNFSETIDLSNPSDYPVGGDNKGYKINAGKGDDKITGTAGNDEITGGLGSNTIYASQGNDAVILTNGENLTIDVTSVGLEGDEKLVFSKDGNDLVMNKKDNTSNSIRVSKFIKSNGVGKKGNVSIKYSDNDGDTVNLDDVCVSNGFDIKTNSRNKTMNLTGTRLADKIIVDGADYLEINDDLDETQYKINIKAGEGNNHIELSDASATNSVITGNGADEIHLTNTGYFVVYEDERGREKVGSNVTTVKAGNGENKIYVDGSCNNLIITGKDNDKFYFDNSNNSYFDYNKTTVKAGGGENTLVINNKEFGDVTLVDEKIKNTTNKIVFDVTNAKFHGDNYSLGKRGDDLRISYSESSALTIKNYFSKGKTYSTKTINGVDLETIMKNVGEYGFTEIIVGGSGTLYGTEYDDWIQTSDDTSETKAKNDKIYVGAGNDTIDAGLGKNTIYITSGIDTIANSTLLYEEKPGQDTLVFARGSKLTYEYVTYDEGKTYDMHVHYTDKNSPDYDKNYVVIEGIATYNDITERYYHDLSKTSVYAFKVGTKTYTLDSLFNRNDIENPDLPRNNTISGTKKHDNIYITSDDKYNNGAEIKIAGGAGNDDIMVGSNVESEVNNSEGYNIDPYNYKTIDIKPIVYTSGTNGKQDKTVDVYDVVRSYAKNSGEYYAQSAISDIKVYGATVTDVDNTKQITGTNDTYYANVNQFTKIYDEGGVDVLNIKDAKSSDLTMIFDVTKDYKSITKCDEYTAENIENSFQEVKILTKAQLNDFITHIDEYTTNDGLQLPSIGIDIDYWGDKGEHLDDDDIEVLNQYKGYWGCGIETIKASDNVEITSQQIDELAQTVASWLKTNYATDDSVNSVKDVFNKGGDDAAAILQVFVENNPWTSAE